MIKSLPLSPLKTNEPLSQHTYFKIGGPADWFYEAHSAADLTHAVQICLDTQTPYSILGGGSNILVGDKGFRGLVIKNRADAIKIVKLGGTVSQRQATVNQAIVRANSGTLLNKLVRYTIEENLAGLEVFLSVPGTVGGAIYNNSHYRPEENEFIGNLVQSAALIDQNSAVKSVPQAYFKFNYDFSILQKTHEVVVSVDFLLTGGNKDQLWQTATAMVSRRNQRQPLGIACSGCTFKNIAPTDALRLGTPDHTQSAGYLIDAAGLKGYQLGQARISPVHAAFIENLGGATAAEVVKLIHHIQAVVLAKFGVTLDPEIFLVGEF